MTWIEQPILVTGATGFIGGRVCERLVMQGATRVRGLVHTIRHAPRVARLPIELCRGSLIDRDSLSRALNGVKTVIHCGLGAGKGIVRGMENMLELAKASGVEKFVHMSTAAVYGYEPMPGDETEDAPPRYTGDEYCDNKIRAERLANNFVRHGLPVVILRPSIVYGPYSKWSIQALVALRRGEAVLIDGGEGACNTTHVDNLVDAVFLSAKHPRAVGEAFFITDGEPVTWGDFLRAHAAMMDHQPFVAEMSKEEILDHYRSQPGFWKSTIREGRRFLMGPELKKLMMPVPLFGRPLIALWRRLQVMDEDKKKKWKERLRGPSRAPVSAAPTFYPDPDSVKTQSHKVFFRIDKARNILGYEPRVSFAQGINLAEQWLRFANYL